MPYPTVSAPTCEITQHNVGVGTAIIEVTTGQTLRAIDTMPGWSNANIPMNRFTLNNERRRGTIAHRDNITALANITNKATKTLIVDN